MDKQAHLLFLKDSLKRSQREAKGWRRLGLPQEFIDLHNEEDKKLQKMIEELEKEIQNEEIKR